MFKADARTYYTTPTDDALTPLMALVGKARTKIRVLAYSLGYAPLVDLLIAKHAAGVDVALVLDLSESVQPFEAPLIAKLTAAGVPLVIGTSTKLHALMHAKLVTVDDRAAFWGSGNLTHAGLTAEDGVLCLERSAAVVAGLAAFWQTVHDGIANAKMEGS